MVPFPLETSLTESIGAVLVGPWQTAHRDVDVIPIKRREAVRKRSPSPVPKRTSRTVEDIPRVTRVVEDLVTEDDEDDEDLGTPRKRVSIRNDSHEIPKPITVRNKSPSPVPNRDIPPTKAASKVDWIGDLFFNDAPPRPAKRPFKRDKVSLAAQLEESSLKGLGKKKAISLKDHFRHLES